MNVLQVHMFGEFRIVLNDEVLEFPGGIYSKTMRLLILLLYYGQNGIPRQKVLDELYGDSEPGNDAGNLRAVAFRLRRQMTAAGLLDEDQQINEKGIFRWIPRDIEVHIDAKEFETAVERAARIRSGAEEGDLLEVLERTFTIYRGEFLPALAAELWVASRQAAYQEEYFDCMRLYIDELEARGQYDQMLNVAREISHFYPYEEWMIAELDALMALDRWKEALEAAEQSTKMLMDRIGIHPSEEMLSRVRDINVHMKGSAKGLLEIRDELEETPYKAGAYYCDYPSFVGAYRYEIRKLERTGQSLFLVLCTITERDGSLSAEDPDGHFENIVEELGNVLRISLRRTDVYTRYGKNQFLLILVGIKQEDCSIAYARIERNFSKVIGSGHYRLHYFMTPVTSPAVPDDDRQMRFGGRLW